MPVTEKLDGYVVDLICLRHWPADHQLDRAREHPRQCLLSARCIDSGYALIAGDGAVVVLDESATPEIMHAVRLSGVDKGIKLHVERHEEGGRMRTRVVQEIPALGGGRIRSQGQPEGQGEKWDPWAGQRR